MSEEYTKVVVRGETFYHTEFSVTEVEAWARRLEQGEQVQGIARHHVGLLFLKLEELHKRWFWDEGIDIRITSVEMDEMEMVGVSDDSRSVCIGDDTWTFRHN